MTNCVASMITFLQQFFTNKGAGGTRAKMAPMRLTSGMVTVGWNAAWFDTTRGSSGGSFVAARECDYGETAMALQIFRYWRGRGKCYIDELGSQKYYLWIMFVYFCDYFFSFCCLSLLILQIFLFVIELHFFKLQNATL